MEYYHNIITQKSWDELIVLRGKLDFVLIGGWAVFLYAKTLKSKDIDIIIAFEGLPVLEKNYQLSKNERLNKYEARKDEIEIDVYLPHYSKLGIPVEDLQTKVLQLEGFKVLKAEYLIALKIYTLSQRGRSAKGRKDLLDIISLITSRQGIWPKVKIIIARYSLESEQKLFLELLNENSELIELNINKHYLAKIKKAIELEEDVILLQVAKEREKSKQAHESHKQIWK